MSSAVFNQNRYIINKVLENIFTAISEHRWKDALLLLPSVAVFGKSRVSPYFLWKVMHVTMASTHIPFGIQMNIFNVILKSSIKTYSPVLDMMAYQFGNIDDKDMEALFEAVNDMGKHKIAHHKIRVLCNAYYAMHYYLKWKNAHLSTESSSLSDSKSVESNSSKEIEIMGFKAHRLLKNAFILSRSEWRYEVDTNKTNEEDNSENPKLMCEWLLGPLLDLQFYLNIEENNGKSKNKHRLLPLKSFQGLDLIEEYVNSHSSHLPALRTYYFYLIKYHLEEKTTIHKILQRIVDLSPESSLTLQYVHTILTDQLGENFRGNQTKKDADTCLLENLNIDELMKCLNLLSKFIEFQMWRKDIRAWKTLTDILKVFHRCWVSCWNCTYCVSSRERIATFSDELSDWPNFVWHDHWLSSLSKDDVEVLVYTGYSSFILGFSDQIAKHSMKCLEQLECNREGMKLFTIMKQKGNFNKDLLLHLGKQRMNRSFILKKKLSKSRVITKKNIKFGADIEDSDSEIEFVDESSSGKSIISKFTPSIAPIAEENNIKENDSITSDVSVHGEKIMFGKRKRIEDSTPSSSSHQDKEDSDLGSVCENTHDESYQEKKTKFGRSKICTDKMINEKQVTDNNSQFDTSDSENLSNSVRRLDRIEATNDEGSINENTRNDNSSLIVSMTKVQFGKRKSSYSEKSPKNKKIKMDIDTKLAAQNMKLKENIQNKSETTLNKTLNVSKTNNSVNSYNNNQHESEEELFKTQEDTVGEENLCSFQDNSKNMISTKIIDGKEVYFGTKKNRLDYKSPTKFIKKGTCNKDFDFYDWF